MSRQPTPRQLFPQHFLLFAAIVMASGCLLAAGARVRGILLNTALLSGAVAAIAVPVGLAVALILARTDAPRRRGLFAVFGLLLFVPLYLHVAAWQAGFGVAGWFTHASATTPTSPLIDGWRGAIWIHALAALPAVVWIVGAALRNLPAAAEEAASLVASPARVLLSITLPAARPAVVVAALWVMVSVAAEMTVTDFFQIRTFAEEVYTQAAAGGFPTDNPAVDYAPWSAASQASGLIAGVALLALLTFILLVSVLPWLARPAEFAASSSWYWRLGRARWLATAAVVAVLCLVVALPVASLVYQAGLGATQVGDGWQQVWSIGKLRTELFQSIGLHARELRQTCLLAFMVAAAATLLAIAAAWRIRNSKRPPYGLLSLFAIALATPGPLLGLATIHLLNHPADSALYPLTIAYDQSLLAPWLVQTIRFTPVAAIVVAIGFASVPESLFDAARADGASSWGRLWRIALPMSWPTVVAAWLVTFALSVGELAATVLVMPPGTPTITIRLFSLLHQGVDDRVAAISLVLLAGVALLAAAAVWMGGRLRQRGDGYRPRRAG